jgi:hypothetical protein
MSVFDGSGVIVDLIKHDQERWILRADYDFHGTEGELLASTIKVNVYL